MSTKAELAFREMRGCEGPLVVGEYQYPLLVLPVRRDESDPTYWQRSGYAALGVPPGFDVYLRAAVSNERVPALFAALLERFVAEGGRPIVQHSDDFHLGPARSAAELRDVFERWMEQLANDGGIGFGVASSGSPPFVVLVDQYKHVRIFAGDRAATAPLTELLEGEHGLTRADDMPFLSDVPCARGVNPWGQYADFAAELGLERWTPPPFLR